MTISEVAKKYQIPESTLRWYERVGLLPRAHRNDSGVRDYSEEEENAIVFVKCMRAAGVSVEALKEYLSLPATNEENINKRKELLRHEQEKLLKKKEDLEKALERLEYKIAHYDEIMRH